MKQNLLPFLCALCALPLLAAEPKDDVKAAIKRLADKPNYTWVATVKSPGAQFNAGPTTGRTEKNGFTVITQINNEQTTEVVLKDTNGVVKTEEGWKTAAELPAPPRGGGAGAGGNRSLMAGRFLLNTKTPAEFLGDLVGKIKEMQKGDGGFLAGSVSEEGAKELLTFRRRPGGNNPVPTPTDAKAVLKVWLKDGQLTQYELAVSGKISFNGNERDVDRTTTVAIKDVGHTEVKPHDDARKKLTEPAKEPAASN